MVTTFSSSSNFVLDLMDLQSGIKVKYEIVLLKVLVEKVMGANINFKIR